MIAMALSFTLCLTGFWGLDEGLAQGPAKERSDLKGKAGALSNPNPGPRQVIRLVGASSEKLTLPPPCSVVAINGKKVTLKDFLGQVKTVEVEESKNIQVGDTVVVKNGVMRIGISPM